MVSKRLASIEESATMRISSEAKRLNSEGFDIIDLGVGEPDFDTPRHICDAACRHMMEGKTRYTPTNGIPELRRAIAKKFREENRIPAVPDDVIVTPGAKMAVFAAIQALLDEGDEMVLIGPSWVSYEPCIKFAGGRPVWADVDQDFMPIDLPEAITERTKAILVNSPCNPTGAVFGREVMREIRDLAIDHDIYVVSDEVYEKIIYGHEHISIASLPDMADRTITINGFSKSYAMTGWRLGYLTGPRDILKWVSRLLSHSVSHPTTFVQWAGIAALEGPQDNVRKMTEEFRARRDLLVEGLRSLGIRCALPGGAFYTFPDVSHLGGGDVFAERLLKEAKIAVTPGSAFGPGGDDYVRISYATSRERIKEALERMESMLSG